MKWRTSLIVFGIMFFLISINFTSAWWDTDYNRRKTINIEGGESILTDFTVLINMTYDSDMQADFDDLRFINGSCTIEGTTELDYELDKKTNSNSALVWVKIPHLQTGTNQICLYYGNSGASSGEDMLNAWDSNYKGVYHFTEGSGTHIEDSTGNGNGTLSASGVTWNTTGQLGNSLLFDGAADTGTFLNISNNTNARFEHPDVTFEIFGIARSSIGNYDALMSSGDGTPGATDFYWSYATSGGMRYGNDIGGWNADFTIEFNNLSYFAMAYQSGDFAFRLNNDSNTSAQTQTLNANSGLYVGQGFGIAGSGYAWDGVLDEVRISNVKRSDVWLNRSYDNLFYQNLVTFGSEEVSQIAVVNSVSYNSTTYEMFSEGFTVNVTYDNNTWTSISANLSYNGTTYVGTQGGSGGNIIFSTNLYVGTGNLGNRSFNWTIYYSNSTDSNYTSSSNYNQTIEKTDFGLCNSSLTIPYINFTFKDEETMSLMDAFVDASSWNYWLTNSSDIQTFTFSNITDQHSSYAFCLSPPDVTLNVNLSSFKYSNTTHQQRTYSFTTTTLTNTTTDTVLYLLGSDDGIYSSMSIISSTASPISGALVTIERQIDSAWTLIGQTTSGDDGLVTFWVNPNYAHRVTVSKTGYTTTQVSLTPSQSLYSITLSETSGNASYTSPIPGLLWEVHPGSGVLDVGSRNFNATITSNRENLENCKFEVINASNISQVLASATNLTNSSHCYISFDYTTVEDIDIFGRLSVDTTNTTGFVVLDADWKWIIIDLGTGKPWRTLKSFFEDVGTISEFGEGNKGEFSRIIVFFVLMTIGIGVFSYFTGSELASPGISLLLCWIIVITASVGGFLTFESGSDNVNSRVEQFGFLLIFTIFLAGYGLNTIRRANE